MEEIILDTYKEPGLFIQEYIDFSNGKISFHQGEESKQNEEDYGHSAFDRIVEYDIADIDNMIKALEKHFKEQEYPESEIKNELDLKSKKLLNLAYSYYSDKTDYYWEDLKIEIFSSIELTKKIAEKLKDNIRINGYQPKQVLYKTLSNLESYFKHFGIKTIKDNCL